MSVIVEISSVPWPYYVVGRQTLIRPDLRQEPDVLWSLDGYRALRDHEDEAKANSNAEDSRGMVGFITTKGLSK